MGLWRLSCSLIFVAAFLLRFVLTPTLRVGTSYRVTGPEGVNFHQQHHHPLFFTSWRLPNMQAKVRCCFVIIRLLWRSVHILSFQNPARCSSQVMYSSTCPKFSSLRFFLSWEHNIFHCCYATECARALSLYYSLYLINEEQAPCLCLFITSLDVTFEDKETSLMIYNISYTLCTDSKL